jgi:hypothetical protein
MHALGLRPGRGLGSGLGVVQRCRPFRAVALPCPAPVGTGLTTKWSTLVSIAASSLSDGIALPAKRSYRTHTPLCGEHQRAWVAPEATRPVPRDARAVGPELLDPPAIAAIPAGCAQ